MLSTIGKGMIHGATGMFVPQGRWRWRCRFTFNIAPRRGSPGVGAASAPWLGFRTGIPRVGNLHTAPIPANTVPVTGTGMPRPVNRAVSHKTRGIMGTRGCVLIHPSCNLAKATYMSSDMYCAFHKVMGWWMWGWHGLPLPSISLAFHLPRLTSPPPLPLHVRRTDHLISFCGRAR